MVGSADQLYWLAAGNKLECIGLPGTPACDIDAPIINVANGEPADFERLRKTIQGKLALVHGAGSHRLEKYTRAVMAGCAGFIFGGTELGCLPPTGKPRVWTQSSTYTRGRGVTRNNVKTLPNG